MTEPLTAEEIAEMMHRNLATVVEIKNANNLNGRPELYISKQTDIPGQYGIYVDFPTESDAIKNHYIVQIVIMLNGSDKIFLTVGSELTSTQIPLSAWRSVKNKAKEAIITF